MKKIIIFLFIFIFSSSLVLSNTGEALIEIDAHIKKVMFVKENKYKISMLEHAAVYYANEAVLPCLRKSLNEKTTVILKINSDSLQITECKSK